MSKNDWLGQLQHILNCPVQIVVKTLTEWKDRSIDADAAWIGDSQAGAISAGQRLEKGNRLWFAADVLEDKVTVLETESAALTLKEKELVSWTLQHAAKTDSPKDQYDKNMSDTERYARKISDWILTQLETSEPAYSLPGQLMTGTRLYREMIPFLLITEQHSAKQAAYKELEKLLRSFMSEDILLIPLTSQEWLIWGPMSLLKDEEQDTVESSEDESVEESLASIVSALHEMLASEWLGECHLAVTHPVSPSKGIVETTITLRETINLGRKFHIGTNIHLPWMLQLERLLNAIPEQHRTRYLEQSLKRTDLFVESEMLATLETFFQLDCNVSETAKKLYIHRNTLLYRLDKLKQETGLDVRQFRDAVLVKIILLLYKVTKRH
ncbi:helix-turn-helix domain-containing protein [Paenibacillus sp. J5C_2022]|uniref:PucR family transcriptional regulator n=1 Tax=Paenibacillus sp. J5C2022 TaxID=2977129 RepID=UPI0021D05CE5|nr:helix-turn-helix domain-containing protein [Paenibacillus sp. J5C2022]MCU6712364.1 helix-turn-helix domain-containing protein [Paenibacillus sp. J5C2022]